ncbi:MAG: hypothetical protein DRJ15_07335, partial [Bacteroidetes bacterium]
MRTDYHIKVEPKYYIPAIVFILSLVIFGTIYNSNRIKNLHSEYHNISDETSVNGIIDDIYIEKGASFVTLKDGNKLFIDLSRNYKTENISLHESLQIGDSIVKYAGSDTILLIRGNRTEYYIIG